MEETATLEYMACDCSVCMENIREDVYADVEANQLQYPLPEYVEEDEEEVAAAAHADHLDDIADSYDTIEDAIRFVFDSLDNGLDDNSKIYSIFEYICTKGRALLTDSVICNELEARMKEIESDKKAMREYPFDMVFFHIRCLM